MAVPFVKATACGNDFLIIEGIHAPADLAAFTRRICDRHQGVGADGVEWLFPDRSSDVHARLFNADGSEAEISGNGTRCVAAYWISEHGGQKVTVRTGAGVKTCDLLGTEGRAFEFETDMGEPQPGDEFSIKLAFGEVSGIPVSMGNPHFVVFVKEFGLGWQAEAAEMGKHHDFKYGIN
ncbi:MAG TPA: diaminopimelate epimerase, partial [Terriglobales bacterium]|nr:diaminopimelate epimerase [Terriglobales bacterium]